MTEAALAVAVLALVVSVVSATYTRRSTRVVEETDRRARFPSISVVPEIVTTDARQAFYRIRNDGSQDLDSVLIYRPRTDDGITYPLAPVGGAWADDEIDLGPLPVAETKRFTHCVGTGPTPDFFARVVCRSGQDEWTLTVPLNAGRRVLQARYGEEPPDRLD